ncbi:MAG: xanthine dehydrogenase family protein molybdopterin-binding subunit, partial [Terriglobia bacterium]
MAKKLTTVELDGVVNEVWVEVPENEPLAWPKEADLAVLGKPLPRVDAYEKVSGRARYTHDINLTGMLWMKILRSPYPYARILAVETRKAEALPGVKLVLTHKDVAGFSWYGGRSQLLDTTLRFVGDEVAAVVAVDEHSAAEAIKLIEVEYEELPYVIEGEAALQEGAPAVHEGGNLLRGRPFVYQRGDIEQGFAEADFIVEETFRS